MYTAWLGVVYHTQSGLAVALVAESTSPTRTSKFVSRSVQQSSLWACGWVGAFGFQRPAPTFAHVCCKATEIEKAQGPLSPGGGGAHRLSRASHRLYRVTDVTMYRFSRSTCLQAAGTTKVHGHKQLATALSFGPQSASSDMRPPGTYHHGPSASLPVCWHAGFQYWLVMPSTAAEAATSVLLCVAGLLRESRGLQHGAAPQGKAGPPC